MHTLTFLLLGAAPYVQLPAGDYTICNKETRECIDVSGGHEVTVERGGEVTVEDGEERGAPRGILLSGGVATGTELEGRAGIAFGGRTWFLEPRLRLATAELDIGGWAENVSEIDLGFSFGLDSASRPWFFALALDLGLIIPGGAEPNEHILYGDSMMMPSVMAPKDNPGVNGGVLARVGYALGEHLFLAVEAHIDVALLEHRATRETVSVGVRTGLGFSLN